MAKTLFLLRHAKSSWKDASCPDHDRLLNKRGRRDAPRMARWMLEAGHRPEWILCSTAERTVATAEALEIEFSQSIPLEFDRRLYLASAASLIQTIAQQAPEVEKVLAIGHNPGLERLSEWLTGAPVRIPTATLVSIELSLDAWSDFSSQTRGELQFAMRPKMLA